jgi:beta-xylosidase
MRVSRKSPVALRRCLIPWLLLLLIAAGCGQQQGTGGSSTAQAPAANGGATKTTGGEAPAATETSAGGAPATTETSMATAAATEAATTSAPAATETSATAVGAQTTETATITGETGATSTAGAAGEAGATSTGEAAAGATPGSNEFQNPVLKSDFADPGIIKVDGTFYAYATNSAGKNIQTAHSTDLVHWEMGADAMPALPKWAKLSGGFVWAPEVIKVGDRFNMYYTARDKASDKQCVGVATSDRPDGRFKDTRDTALVCQSTEGGTIDPDPFRDGDKLYLYFKNDGNCCSKPTYLYAQEMAPDGLSMVGQPTQLVRNDRAWEGRVVEAPTMWKQDNKYYLFFSANNYAGLEYAVGYATCQGPTGPCQDAPENPILKTALKKPPVIGPGHQTIVVDDGKTWIVYHAWEVSSTGTKTDRRFMWVDRLDWKDGKPVVNGPTTDPQPVP